MDAITYTLARAHLASNMDRVCQNHEPLIITRNREQSVVMISLEDYQLMLLLNLKDIALKQKTVFQTICYISVVQCRNALPLKLVQHIRRNMTG